jgi:hypothetical protein
MVGLGNPMTTAIRLSKGTADGNDRTTAEIAMVYCSRQDSLTTAVIDLPRPASPSCILMGYRAAMGFAAGKPRRIPRWRVRFRNSGARDRRYRLAMTICFDGSSKQQRVNFQRQAHSGPCIESGLSDGDYFQQCEDRTRSLPAMKVFARPVYRHRIRAKDRVRA